MPKHKQYSYKYRQRISQYAVQEISNNLQAHKNDEMAYSNYNNCLLEVNNNETNFISEIALDEIIPEVTIGDNILSDEYDNNSSSKSENNDDININRLRRNLVK